MKRLLSLVLTLAIIVGILPATLSQTVNAAAGRFFIFPSEQYDLVSARITNTERVTLKGTLNNVNGSTISYSVFQIPKDGGAAINSREGQTGNVQLSGSSMTINNLQLFPGLNMITFKGQQGTTEVQDTIYIEYRNGPTLYDLQAVIDGTTTNVSEQGTTVISSSPTGASLGKSNTDIALIGKAPNAEKVTVIINGRSWTYNVSSVNDYKFYASPLNVKQGKNIITIRVSNQTQTVETTREITFYNGRVTFYDVVAKSGADVSADLSSNPDFPMTSNSGVTITGKAIIPYTTGITLDDIHYTLSGAISSTGSVTPTYSTILPGATNVEVEFSIPVTGTLPWEQRVSLALSSQNRTLTPPSDETEGNLSFLPKNKGQAYIYKVNYLSGYSPGMSTSSISNLTGNTMENADLFSTPFAAEILIVNPSGGAVTVSKVTNASDVVANPNPSTKEVLNTTVIENINGVPTSVQRIVLEISKLPVSGKQNIYFSVAGGVEKKVPVTLLYGPYVKFDGAYDDMKIYTDTTEDKGVRLASVMTTALMNFKGQLINVASDEKIEYGTTGQTVFLYINNTLVKLTADGADPSVFSIASTDLEAAYDALFPGDNNIKFLFKTSKNTYEKNFVISLIPTNVPVIPAPATDGVYPYSTTYLEPKPNDTNFQLKGSVYMTKEASMNVHGTFDFLDLGTSELSVQTKLGGMGTDVNNYILLIQTPGEKPIEWNLGNSLTSLVGGAVLNPTTATEVPGISVYYDLDHQYFGFIMKDIKIPVDGSPKVYTMSVYNSGKGGPKATYRLEVNPISIPYTVVAPLTQKRIINQNYVEVVIYSEGAEKVVINKVVAEKINYDPDYDGIIEYAPAYRAVVKNLKANKDTKIDLVISRGKDQIKDSFTVKYVPTSIPGAEFRETMKSSHKVFEGAVNIKFEKGTNLIRKDYNVAEQFKTQVFSNHDILFAIANSSDGVVNRHEFDSIPANYDFDMALGKQVFIGNFQQRFVKSSSVYWIDAGLADDINTPNSYDPITYGNDPYQFPNAPVANFYKRNASRELIPSKEGTLTLTYDNSIAEDAGRLVTVFRFDAVLQQWENIGGVVDAKKHTVKVPFNRFGYYVVAKLGYSYNDTVQHPYARDYIESIFAKGIMNAADPSSQFGADIYVGRAEFARMIVRALDTPLDYDGSKHFVDIPSDIATINYDGLWDFRYVETAARAGIIRGVEPQVFAPDDNIMRQDAAVMIARGLNLKLETDRAKVTKELEKYFKDYTSIDYYAQPSVLAIAKKGFITGSPIDPTDLKKGYSFNPKANTLRGDAAIIIGKVMVSLKKLPKI